MRQSSAFPNRAPSIAMVLPAYNEEEAIAEAIAQADDALASLTPPGAQHDYEVIVVDDGSRDATREVALAAAAERPHVRVLSQPRNMGYGAALSRGFRESTKDWVGFTDADCQFDLREINRLAMLAGEYDVVCGYRIDRQDPWHRCTFSRMYNFAVRTLLGTQVRDCDCALKLFHRDVVNSLEIESTGFFVNAEVLAKARMRGCSVVEVGVTHRPRCAGESTVGLKNSLPAVASLLRFWWQKVLFPQSTAAQVSVLQSEPRSLWSRMGTPLLILATLVLLLWNLSYPLIEPDETRYAQIALEMVHSGDWVIPTLDGQPYLDKPPLLYWLTSLSYTVFGASELTARLPCALAAVLTVLATYFLGRKLIGRQAARNGAFLLLASVGFVLSGRFLIMDGLLTLFTTTTLLLMYLGGGGKEFRLGWWLAGGVACGLGILTKGPVAPVLCLPPLLVSRWLAADSARVRARDWLAWGAAVLAVAAPWFVIASQRNPEFLEYFFWKHNVVRFAQAFDHRQPFWYYLPTIAIGAFPCSILLPRLAYFLGSRSEEQRQFRTTELGYLVLAAAWIVTFFSLSRCKLPPYILPVLPMLSLLMGKMLSSVTLLAARDHLLQLRWTNISRRMSFSCLVAAGGVAIADLVFFHQNFLEGLSDWLAVAIVACLAAVLWMFRRAMAQFSWVATAVIAIGSSIFIFGDFLPEWSEARSIHQMAKQIHEESAYRDNPIVYFDRDAHSASFTMPDYEFVVFQKEELAQLEQYLQAHPQAVIVSSAEAAQELQDRLTPAFQFAPFNGREDLHTARLNGSGSKTRH